jgi:hypothetical protein
MMGLPWTTSTWRETTRETWRETTRETWRETWRDAAWRDAAWRDAARRGVKSGVPCAVNVSHNKLAHHSH